MCIRDRYEGMDFSFPGALPLEWKRVYHSDSNFKGALGIGVHSLADMRLFLYPIAQCIGLLLADGRICGFDYVEEGEVDFCRINRLELRKRLKGYEVYDLEKRFFYNFEYFNHAANSYLLTSVTDLDGRSIRLSYENGGLATLTDALSLIHIFFLERSDQGKYIKADIFDHPTAFATTEVTVAADPTEALVSSLTKYGSVELDYMLSLIHILPLFLIGNSLRR